MLLKDIKYSLKDITIVPAKISEINSRKECNPRDKWGYLPIISAPMYGILNQNNWETFNKHGIHSMLPRYREEDWNSYDEYMNQIQQGVWAAISIKDFEDWFCNENKLIGQELACYNICIDTANGHMKRIYELCDKAKQLAEDYNYELNIMVGNIANPETLEYCWNSKGELIVDYVRLGIGGGQVCTTASSTGIFYPMASLIDECRQFLDHKFYSHINPDDLDEHYELPKLVADGGIRGISDIIKALALGADYVMLGTVLARCKEASAETFANTNGELVKLFYGMSTPFAQKYYKNGENRRTEGRRIEIKTEYTIEEFVNEFEDYMRSAMSYCNARTLNEFKPNCVIISPTTQELQKR